ncbi:hypothetical protein [Streptomyces sp. NBC_01508]|uniref:hypothetical protein n=1 Tax=Streptomyces sp. NBC_01508 TaxID=2903888 RepID=UPI003866F047
MKVRADVTQLLRQGHTNLAVARATGATPKTVAAYRRALGIPPTPPGRPTNSTLKSRFQARTEPLPGGHMRWTGSTTSRGTPTVRYGKQHWSGLRMAFALRWDREPVGHVLPGCDMPRCVAPDHVQDQQQRDQLNETFAAIFGNEVAS